MEFHELQQIVESNSRAIQAMLDAQASDRLQREELRQTIEQIAKDAAEERAELRRATLGIANLLASLDSDRPTILGRLSRIENKLDRILAREDGSGDEPLG